ncbi:MAG TPA: hypothetical protein VGR35_23070, partial [Tepidisphaeraceae bacterium]|nr:hypothetical protein [Tepidisphaeraceae bacterium]
MNTTPTFILAPRRVSRKRKPMASQAPAALNLVAAELDLGGPWVTLTFDRAIDVAGFVGSAIVVEDETAGTNVSRHRAGD